MLRLEVHDSSFANHVGIRGRPMSFESIAAYSLTVLSIIFGFIYMFHRALNRDRQSNSKKRFGFYRGAGIIGNALQTLQVFTRPSVQHAIVEMLDEEAHDYESGGPDHPAAHLHKQARLIRRAKPPERLTTWLKRPPE